MNRILTVASFGMVLGILTALILIGIRDDGGGETSTVESDWGFFTDPTNLVTSSDVILLAEVGDHTTETVELRSPQTGEVTGARVDRLQSFKAIDVLKGEAEPSLVVRMTESLTDKLPSGGTTSLDLKVPDLEPGVTYILFLDATAEGSGSEMIPSGLPWIAESSDSGLRFMLSSDQEDGLRDLGIQPGESGAGPALDLTVNSLRAVISATSGGESRTPGP